MTNKVIIDTNVLVSSLMFGGNARMVTDLVVNRMLEIVYSIESVNELRSIVSRKFSEFYSQVHKFEEVIFQFGTIYKLSGSVKYGRDPKDDYLLELAQVSDAEFIITGDKDLLTIQYWNGCLIMNPSGFLKYYNDELKA